MKKDKRQHLLLIGPALIAYGLAGVWIAANVSQGAAVAWFSTVGGTGYEVNQGVRKQGEPSVADAFATSALGLAYWAFELFGAHMPNLGSFLPNLGI